LFIKIKKRWLLFMAEESQDWQIPCICFYGFGSPPGASHHKLSVSQLVARGSFDNTSSQKLDALPGLPYTLLDRSVAFLSACM
jgi:hypothetical protein